MRERYSPRTIGWPVCLWLLCCVAAPAGAQLDKGHRILLERGFQIQATAVDQPETPNWTVFDNAGWNAVDFAGNFYGPANYLGPAPGNHPWTAWYHDYSHTSFSAAEAPYASNCVAIQLDDEQNLNDATVRSNVANWFAAARPNYPNTILHINQIPFAASDGAYRDFMVNSRPDMLMIDSYRWVVDNSEGTWNLFSDMQRHRKFALSGHDGTGVRPIPYGIYPQAIKSTNFWRVPSESELRVNHFAAWGLGYKLTRAFTYNTYFDYAQGIFLTDGFKQAEPTPSYFQVKEINRQGTNLGPALVRLLSKDVLWVGGRERDADGNVVWNPQVPIDMNAYPRSGGPYGGTGFNNTVKDPYIRGVGTIMNLGTTNDGLQGDVLLTWFQVLDESFDGPASGEWYFMITNALVDPTGSAADCRQQIKINYDFGASGITMVQRLDRDSGLIEDIFLPVIPNSGGRRQLTIELDGGTADLFKFKTGAPFVGVPEPQSLGLLSLWGLLSLCRAPRHAAGSRSGARPDRRA